MDPRDVQSIPLFAGLSKDDQKVVAQYADEVDVEPGHGARARRAGWPTSSSPSRTARPR